MENLKILNKKESERILDKINEQFGIKNIESNYIILQKKDGKIFLINNSFGKIEYNTLRINELGLYVARFDKEIRLTIEGSQIFGKHATKNVYEVNENDANSWMEGDDIECNKEFKGFVIIKYKDNYLGSGKCKNNKLLNYIPQERRIRQKKIINI
ncbi:MAG: hypothetical protein AABX61_03405 [Nanoarchaeota archaeon]